MGSAEEARLAEIANHLDNCDRMMRAVQETVAALRKEQRELRFALDQKDGLHRG